MTVNLSAAGKRTLRAVIGIVIMGIALGISAYSIYYVARHLGVPRIFAACFSTAFDGVAVFAADKSLQYAQEGRSGAFPRIVMAVMVATSAWLNALHPILGHENLLVIPMWAGLPVSVAAAFELHTSQARAKAHARLGYQYPAPMPKWAGFDWLLFPLDTMDKFRDIARSRSDAVALANSWLPKSERSARKLANRPPVVLSASVAESVTVPPDSASPASSGSATDHSNATAPGSATAANATATAAGSAMAPEEATESGPDTSPQERSPESATARPRAATASATARPWSGNASGSATVECWQCHKQFVPLRKTARYCGSNCRTAACRARKAEAS